VRRRFPSLAQQISASLKPYFAGRIDKASCGYRFGENGYTNPQGVYFKPCLDDNRKSIELYQRLSVRCPSVEIGGEYPLVRDFYSVPETVCKKCPHRIAKGCCEILRARRAL